MNKKFNVVLTVIIIQLLFATLMTSFNASFPANHTISQFDQNVTSINQQVTNAQKLQSQFSGNNSIISAVNTIQLIFNSGNLIYSFMANLFFAFPNMAMMLMQTVFYFFPISVTLESSVLLFTWAIVFIIYTVVMILLLVSLWSNPSSLI